MENRLPSREGALGWAICAGVAIAFDLNMNQTMSEYARQKFREHPAPFVGLLALSAFHLTRPDSMEKFDPISQLGEVIWQMRG